MNFLSMARERLFAYLSKRVPTAVIIGQHRYSHLDRTRHGAQSKNRCTVFDSGLAIKGTLGIHE